MAARKKVKASARKKQQSTMPPEMRAAMSGAPQAPQTAQRQSAANDWMSALTHVPATDDSMMSHHFYIEIPRLDESGKDIVHDVEKVEVNEATGNPETITVEELLDPIIFDKTAYWKAETPKQRDGYIVDLGQQRMSTACLKCVFIRLLDENGDRVFTTEQQFARLQSAGITEALETIGSHILGISFDESERPKETTVASEKED